jgi:transposase
VPEEAPAALQRVVEQERTLTKAAESAEVSVRTARKWVGRYPTEGRSGLGDRSSVSHRQPTRTSDERVQPIAALRRLG